MTEALSRFGPELHHKSRNGYSTACASPSSELHEIGLRSIAYAPEAEGWIVHYLGHNTPRESLRSFARTTKPNLVCLSLTRFEQQDSPVRDIAALASELPGDQGKLAIGGNKAASLKGSVVPYDCLCSSAQDLIRYTRAAFALKPGPKAHPRCRPARDSAV